MPLETEPYQSAPRRVQRRRTKGWRMPENTISVTRPGRWGNPFRMGMEQPAIRDAEHAVELYRHMLSKRPDLVAAARRDLQGKNLACFCSPAAACHADVLLEIANAE